MENSFNIDYQKYTDFLKDQVQFRYIIAIILAILFVALAVLIFLGYINMGKKENSMKRKILCVLLCLCLFSIMFYFLGKQIYIMNTDIDSNAYIVYEGDFTYEYVRHTIGPDVSEVTFVINEEELTITTEHLNITSGTYTGRIVYAKNSKYLLDYEIFEDTKNPNE